MHLCADCQVELSLLINMDYEVVIPSYRRPAVLKKKTWKMLTAGGVPPERITIFVADVVEEHMYRAALPAEAKIRVGVLGLVAQRAFAASCYPPGTRLLFVDDDITRLKALSEDKAHLHDIEDVDHWIQCAFATMEDNGSRIFGIYPAASAMYMKPQPEVTMDLRYIIGALYGIISTDVPVLTYGDNQEDKERTLRYWDADKKLIRFNHVTILTRYYAPGGMDSPSRKAETNRVTQQLVTKWPYQVKRIYKPKQQIWDLKFLPQLSSDDPEDLDLTVLEPRSDHATVRDALLTELRKVTIPKLGNGSKTEEQRKHHGVRADVIGSVGRSATFGFGNTRKGLGEFRYNKKYPALLRALIAYGNRVVPPGWKYTAITLNHGVLARKHRDSSNVGRSVIVGIGDYTDGALRVWNAENTVHEDLDLKDKPTMFNGAMRTHETQPFVGERYTIIYYRQKWQGVCAGMPEMCGSSESDSSDDSSP